MKKPVLAICYGMQLVTKNLKGAVKRSTHREYGHTIINIKKKSLLFKGIIKKKIKVWMSHGDNINKIPKLFSITSLSNNKIIDCGSPDDFSSLGNQEVHDFLYGGQSSNQDLSSSQDYYECLLC